MARYIFFFAMYTVFLCGVDSPLRRCKSEPDMRYIVHHQVKARNTMPSYIVANQVQPQKYVYDTYRCNNAEYHHTEHRINMPPSPNRDTHDNAFPVNTHNNHNHRIQTWCRSSSARTTVYAACITCSGTVIAALIAGLVTVIVE